jgi:hypothetical protein
MIMDKTYQINVELRDRSKKLLQNGKNLLECSLDENNNKIFRVSVKPIVNRLHEMSDGTFRADTGVSGLNQVGVVSELVKSVACVKIGTEEVARVNGSIDFGLHTSQKRLTLDEAWFTDEDVANAICVACAEIEVEKLLAIEEEVAKAKSVLLPIRDFYANGGSEPKTSSRSRARNQTTDREVVAEVLEAAADAIRDENE